MADFEMLPGAGLCIAGDGTPAWTLDTDNLTTTLKLKHPIVMRNFQSMTDETYGRAPLVAVLEVSPER